MKVIIIVPTYNERDNIAPLLAAIRVQFKRIPHQVEILVVDDNSPDGTGEIVKKQRQGFSELHLLTGNKEGLGAAYVRGMKYACSQLKADVVMQMDADFSHKPEDIPRMLEALTDVDFVVGSRYVAGGKIPENWSLWRKLNSKWGNVLTRRVAGLSQVRDCTAGFRAIRAQLLKKIDLDKIGGRGYCFQIDLLFHAIANGGKIREIPVEFVDRVHGKSKLGISDIMEFLMHVWWLRWTKIRHGGTPRKLPLTQRT